MKCCAFLLSVYPDYHMSMHTPLIGITTYRSLSRQNYPILSASEVYVQSVTRAGGCAVLIPLGVPDEKLADLVLRLDGVIFSGGGDVNPERYGSQAQPWVNSVDEDRDRVEINLFEAVLPRKMPFLGICRGIQLINVAMGGSLYEDLIQQGATSLKHNFSAGEARDYLAHPVKIESDSRLGQILGVNRVEVNSLHHQGIRNLAQGLRPTAWAPDGVIEAVEIPDHPFGLAVQWHPEWLQGHLAMRSLFQKFVRSASEYSSNR